MTKKEQAEKMVSTFSPSLKAVLAKKGEYAFDCEEAAERLFDEDNFAAGHDCEAMACQLPPPNAFGV